ncbi:cell division protein Cdc14 [Pseudoneurospora amorphoporcata]|uniref:Cell division protein Cdc14 n=1 Tax=Pseudoneurospora amorphoporcata TaxID=241081 RepID=A0AAN6NU78_9PEZI|nr:cell division protein Cdc14 [Pseudoneurospora amorphoporcata]
MESLLSLAFDNLSAFEPAKIKKGLKQVEGLLAQICLSGPAKREQDAAAAGGQAQLQRKGLGDLAGDPAFREFFKLQEGFEWNVAQRLLTTLDFLVARGGEGQYDLLILNALDLIQGVLLLHPPSKVLFSRAAHMNLLLDLIEPVNTPAIQCATIITLVVALLDSPANVRVFERLDGLLTVASLFKSRETGREVKFRLTEFLYFYLTPEASPASMASSPTSSSSTPTSPTRDRAGSDTASQQGSGSKTNGGVTLSVDVKKRKLDQHLPGVVDALLRDLDRYKPFGGVLS